MPNDSSVEAAYLNAYAIERCFDNAFSNETDRTVEVPAGKTYFIGPVTVKDISNVTFLVQGTIAAIDDVYSWSYDSSFKNVFDFNNCSDLTFTGKGEIDGQGFVWWWHTILVTIHKGRPHLVYMEKTRNVVIEDIHFKNSPMFHLNLR